MSWDTLCFESPWLGSLAPGWWRLRMAGLPSAPVGVPRWGSVHRVCVSCSWILLLPGRGTMLLGALQTLQSRPSDPASPHWARVAVPSSRSSRHPFSGYGEVRMREHHTMEWASRIKAANSYSNPFSLHFCPIVYDP